MRKAGEPPKPAKDPALSKKAPPISIRSGSKIPGIDGAARVKPRMVISEVIRFEKVENFPAVIEWLGSDFYAITTGPVSVPGLDTGKWIQPSKVSGEVQYILIVLDPVRNTYLVCNTGRYVMRHPDGTYSIMTVDELHAKYDYAEDNE